MLKITPEAEEVRLIGPRFVAWQQNSRSEFSSFTPCALFHVVLGSTQPLQARQAVISYLVADKPHHPKLHVRDARACQHTVLVPAEEGHNKWQNGFVGRDGNVHLAHE